MREEVTSRLLAYLSSCNARSLVASEYILGWVVWKVIQVAMRGFCSIFCCWNLLIIRHSGPLFRFISNFAFCVEEIAQNIVAKHSTSGVVGAYFIILKVSWTLWSSNNRGKQKIQLKPLNKFNVIIHLKWFWPIFRNMYVKNCLSSLQSAKMNWYVTKMFKALNSRFFKVHHHYCCNKTLWHLATLIVNHVKHGKLSFCTLVKSASS